MSINGFAFVLCVFASTLAMAVSFFEANRRQRVYFWITAVLSFIGAAINFVVIVKSSVQ